MSDNANGRRWARGFLILALAVSVVGNIAHTVLADSAISLWLRVPGAVVWPVFLFGAIEVLVRITWQRRAAHTFARVFLLAVSIPAAITSYEHLYGLLKMMGESAWIAVIGPAAIDGMMIGCTMVLLFTRHIEPANLNVDAELERLERLLAEQDFAADVRKAEEMSVDLPAPVSPAPAGVRRVRGDWDARRVSELAVDGEKASFIAAKEGVSPATASRFTRVAKMLKANPAAEIDSRTEKVHPDHIAIMRQLVSR